MKKAAIIGCGGISRVHAWALANMEDVSVTALCDIIPDKAHELAAEQLEGRKLFFCEDYRELFEKDVDVVHICTPHYLHAPMAVELLRHGKAVFMEKPCAISMEQFAELKKADAENPGRLGFCFQNRYNESVRTMEKLVTDGEIGTVIGGRAFVTWKRDNDYYEVSDWKGRIAKEGGGVLINQSIHTLDLLLKFLGDPETVKASIANHHTDIEAEDTVEAWMNFKDGKRACFYASNGYITDAPVFLEIQGTKGRLTMSGSNLTLFKEDGQYKTFSKEAAGSIGKVYWGNGHRACIKDFYHCLEDGITYRNNLASVERVFKVIMDIYGQTRKKIYK